MSAHYDQIAEDYKKSKELPCRVYEVYTFFKMLGDIAGKSILDLACGEGSYTRKLKLSGAGRVVGVDISQKMIELARQEEAKQPLGIEYIVGDVLEIGKIGSFDLVVAAYLLNYAQTKEELLKMCQAIFINLQPGGRFVTINDNILLRPEFYSKSAKYGMNKSISGELQEGTPITYTMSINGSTFSFLNYYLSQETYESVFREVGFKQVRWQKLIVSPEVVEEFDQEFWQDLRDYPASIGIECVNYPTA
ncbi:methyltransferase domain-containing protein [Aetokthonos hydrillicola Thurmond2011]|jgi:ubiquinone/menaquinone biosynthesis C-methylase UbiE|uniref:Methyltransferase domain-containing protein n=1 Tax=Aetokthonos hydrillicola Thurmond2011 TaxID=2712845 RepID=A0AAP5M4I1_9CYAN|nr:class I SAM-dependent methyltransferase [Aetokthonos hydrillicola]MBO3464068.1 methyltransferase domain-containing protein [Aetokthonos hydrillicola CCALA 1050]MBW4590071.1 methyltransferase domain-containing protein [Aetokthonos hydrillicola CCALA 1050]MDR9894876.1 methyltransferase domain-containing protein [Aetokthonos hydrillicola Thurmond2011]